MIVSRLCEFWPHRNLHSVSSLSVKYKNDTEQELVFTVKLQFRKLLVQKLCSRPPKAVLHWKPSSIEDCRLSSIEGSFPFKAIFHQKSSTINGCLPSNVFHQRFSSVKSCLPSKIVFHQCYHQRSYSIKGRLPWEDVFHKRFLFLLW